ncbi:MAG: hypothetical protein LBI10_02350 [Deltaproteobacteria bacterium]|jgi:hypothetical protein|nr:hypothetical protein [Deltaproteobacteria bacterium]
MSKNTIEDELDAIRIELYEETKNMTISERLEYYHKQVEPVYQEFGIKQIDSVPQRPKKLVPEDSR